MNCLDYFPSTWLPRILAALQVIVTTLKVLLLSYNRFVSALVCFALDSTIGIALVVLAVVSLQCGRTFALSFYAPAAMAVLVLFELAVIIDDATRLVAHRRHKKELKRLGENEAEEEGTERAALKEGGAAEIVNRVSLNVCATCMYILVAFVYVLLGTALAIYVFIARSGLERAGDKGVEMIVLISFLLSTVNVASYSYNYYRARLGLSSSELARIWKFSKWVNIVLLGYCNGLLILLAVVVVTARKRIYVDAGVMTLVAVQVPRTAGIVLHVLLIGRRIMVNA